MYLDGEGNPEGNFLFSLNLAAELFLLNFFTILFAVHARIYGEHQMSCRLADYVPLLEEKNRAVLNAIPVKQNLSKEAFEELKANIHNKEKVSEILRREAGLPPQVPKKGGSKQIEQIAIKESPNIKQVNLGEYDQLIGKDK